MVEEQMHMMCAADIVAREEEIRSKEADDAAGRLIAT